MNSSNLERDYWFQLFANLVNVSPVDTRNMQSHIVYYENANEFVIEVNAPIKEREELIANRKKDGKVPIPRNRQKINRQNGKTKSAPKARESFSVENVTDYAYAVNYANKSPHQGWIQDQIKQTGRIFNARITFLGGE